MRAFILFAALSVLLLPRAVSAHPLPDSEVLLDFRAGGIDAELRLTRDDLLLAYRGALSDRAALGAYLRAHVKPVTPGGEPWAVEVGALEEQPATASEPALLVAHLRLTPPPGAPTRALTLGFDAITHEVVTHTVLVEARGDDARGTPAKPELLGVVRWTRKAVTIRRPDAPAPPPVGRIARLAAPTALVLALLMVAAVARARTSRALSSPAVR